MEQKQMNCDFCGKPRDETHNPIKCHESVEAIADWNLLRRRIDKAIAAVPEATCYADYIKQWEILPDGSIREIV